MKACPEDISWQNEARACGLGGFPGGKGPPLAPRNRQDLGWQSAQAGVELPDGRPVLEKTAASRAKFLLDFDVWLRERHTSLENRRPGPPPDGLWQTTLLIWNALPLLCGDDKCHVAMPPIILMALLTCCLLWGWRAEAGIFALAWGGLLRIGEAKAGIKAAHSV